VKVGQNLDRLTPARLQVENVGGIEETTVAVEPGITALVGPNATNRTSLLQALAAALGSEKVTLKGDAESGAATLSLAGETYTRCLTREQGTVAIDGEPYLDDADLVDLYAVLLEDNEVRRAVRADEDLRELILRPVDIEEINAEISRLVDEREGIDAELDRLDTLAEELPDLEAERNRLEAELADVEDRLETERAAKAAAEAGEEGVDDALADRLDELRKARSTLENVRSNLEIQHKSLDSLREEKRAVREEYEILETPDEGRIAAVEGRIDDLRERKTSLKTTVNELQQVIQFNEGRLDESGPEGLAAIGGADDDVTDQLLPGEMTVTCWTCGSTVERRQISGMIDRLRELRDEKRRERTELVSRIDDLTDDLADLEAKRDERCSLESRLDELDGKIESRESNVARLEKRESSLEERVTDLEASVERLQESQQEELLALQETVSELAFERDRLADRLDDVTSEMESIEADLGTREDLRSRREAIAAELTDLRTRIDRIETEAIDRFNTHMAAVVDALGYENLERVWIESTRKTVREGRERVAEQSFDLHIVRESEDGTTYEGRIEHLSESEREVIGLVVALAGYLVHDVAERAPFMLLDSLEMIDGERLVELVSYLDDHVPYLVVVLLPDHAEAFDAEDATDHHRISEI